MGKPDVVVVVEWGDAFIDCDDFTLKEAEATTPVFRKTVGFYVAKNQHGIILATDLYDKKEDGMAARMFIPWGMVNEWREL